MNLENEDLIVKMLLFDPTLLLKEEFQKHDRNRDEKISYSGMLIYVAFSK